jgi:exonuclease III
MHQQDVGAWLIQETWEEGEKFNVESRGYHIFRHNADQGANGRNHLFKGVAIILSSLFHEAWRLAESPPPITMDPKDDFTGQLIQLNLKFDLLDSRGRQIKGKSISMTLISVFFPCDDQHHGQFCLLFDSMLNAINPNTQIVIGSDINAQIEVRTCNEYKQVLGPHGIPRSNTRGENLFQVLAAHNLQVENTFFNHNVEEYVTYTSIPTNHYSNGVPSMHDIFACSQSLHKIIHDCQVVLHGVASDHKAVRLKLTLSSVKFKARAIS